MTLEMPMIEHEIAKVIDNWPHNKAASPEGFTSEFYCHFKDLLMTDLVQVFNTITDQTHITWHPLNDSHIILIPKKNQLLDLQNFARLVFLTEYNACSQRYLKQGYNHS